MYDVLGGIVSVTVYFFFYYSINKKLTEINNNTNLCNKCYLLYSIYYKNI